MRPSLTKLGTFWQYRASVSNGSCCSPVEDSAREGCLLVLDDEKTLVLPAETESFAIHHRQKVQLGVVWSPMIDAVCQTNELESGRIPCPRKR